MGRRLRRRSAALCVGAALAGASLLVSFTQLARPVARPAPPMPIRGRLLAQNGQVLATTVDGRRRYPMGQLAGALIGFTGPGGGLEGLEYFNDAALRRGQDVRLTLDPQVQAIAEDVLNRAVRDHQAEWGSLAVVETATGRILALASAPSFDPNRWRAYAPTARRVRPLFDTFEPGSVVKPLVVAALLDAGLTRPDQAYATPMRRAVGGATINDAVPHPARLTTAQILRYSSNVGMSRLVEAMPAFKLNAAFERFGLGNAAPLPGATMAPGRLGNPADWGTLGRATRAFGQGLSVNTLQLAQAFDALASGGQARAPRLLADAPAGPAHAAVDPAAARSTRAMLHRVLEDGLPTQATTPGYHPGGKTGTAQVAVGGRYSPSVYTSTFAGFFPWARPRVTLAIAVRGARHHYQGSQLAAPVFRDVTGELAALWGLPPQPEATCTGAQPACRP